MNINWIARWKKNLSVIFFDTQVWTCCHKYCQLFIILRTCSCHMLLKIDSVVNFDFKKLLIITSYDKWVSYLDIDRPVSPLYKMVVARVTLNLIAQRLLKKLLSIIFNDKFSSLVSYETWHAFLSTKLKAITS